MQATFNGQLGKQSSSLIARMVSAKMPGGFNITAVRKHLETRWGLAQGRQDGVFLAAELGAQTYGSRSKLNGQPAATLVVRVVA